QLESVTQTTRTLCRKCRSSTLLLDPTRLGIRRRLDASKRSRFEQRHGTSSAARKQGARAAELPLVFSIATFCALCQPIESDSSSLRRIAIGNRLLGGISDEDQWQRSSFVSSIRR